MKIEVIRSLDKLAGILKALMPSSVPVALDLETTGVHAYKDKIVGAGLAWSGEEGCYIPIAHLYDQPIDGPKALMMLKDFLHSHLWLAFNVPFEFEFMRQNAGLTVKALDFAMDAQIMAYCTGRFEYVSLKTVSMDDAGSPAKSQSYKEFMAELGLHPTKNSMAEAPLDKTAEYCGGDAIACFRAYQRIYPEVKDTQIYKLEAKVLPVTIWLRSNGLMIKKDFFQTEKERLAGELDFVRQTIEAQVAKATGEHLDFNLGSPAQMAEVLFHKLKIHSDKLTATGKQSTGKDVLSRLKWKHLVVKNIITFREIQKRLSTYYESYPDYASEDGRIHASYNQTGVVTGRFSCSDPNLQNIPRIANWKVDYEGGSREIATNVRNGFGVPDDCWFIEFDYNQIEARLAAGITQEPVLLNAFSTGVDYHTKTASLIFNKPLESISKEERYLGKKLNFALAYGMGPQKLFYELLEELTVTYDEAEIFYTKFHEAYGKMFKEAAKIGEEAQQRGYITTLFGRKVPIFAFSRQYATTKQAIAGNEEGKRMAYNAKIQGTAGDVLKLAMVKSYKLVKDKYGIDNVKLIMSTHDSLSCEVKKSVELVNFIKDMLVTLTLKIPNCPILEAAVEIGSGWGNLKKINDGETVEAFLDRVIGDTTKKVSHVTNGCKIFVVELPVGAAQRTQGQILELRDFLLSKPGENKVVIKIGDKEKELPIPSSIGIDDRERILLMVGGKFYERVPNAG